jgi:hypothetical protein
MFERAAVGLLLCGLAVLGALHVERVLVQRGHAQGVAETLAKVQKVADAKLAENQAIQHRQTDILLGALDAEKLRTKNLVASAGALRVERDRLRDAASAYAGSGGVSGAGVNAAAVRAATLADLLGQCAERYSEVARSADAHASDSLTCHAAWPQ